MSGVNGLEVMLRAAGEWAGTNDLVLGEGGAPLRTAATACVTAVLLGRFVRVDYTWSYEGQPQEGMMLIGYQPKAGLVTMDWADTMHNGRRVMHCVGGAAGDGTLEVKGSYPAPPGPDWGWRTVITPSASGGEKLVITMYNIWPEGKEDFAVRMELVRAGEQSAKGPNCQIAK
jgi:hypothetical protein